MGYKAVAHLEGLAECGGVVLKSRRTALCNLLDTPGYPPKVLLEKRYKLFLQTSKTRNRMNKFATEKGWELCWNCVQSHPDEHHRCSEGTTATSN